LIALDIHRDYSGLKYNHIALCTRFELLLLLILLLLLLLVLLLLVPLLLLLLLLLLLILVLLLLLLLLLFCIRHAGKGAKILCEKVVHLVNSAKQARKHAHQAAYEAQKATHEARKTMEAAKFALQLCKESEAMNLKVGTQLLDASAKLVALAQDVETCAKDAMSAKLEAKAIADDLRREFFMPKKEEDMSQNPTTEGSNVVPAVLPQTTGPEMTCWDTQARLLLVLLPLLLLPRLGVLLLLLLLPLPLLLLLLLLLLLPLLLLLLLLLQQLLLPLLLLLLLPLPPRLRLLQRRLLLILLLPLLLLFR